MTNYALTREPEGRSAPFLFLQFQTSPTAYHRYNDTERAKSYLGDTWAPASFQCEFPGEDGDLKTSAMTLHVQGDLAPGLLMINRPPSFVCRVSVWEANALDLSKSTSLRFSGRAVGAKWLNSGQIELEVEPGSTALALPGRPHMYQRTCPHVLYGNQCRAAKVVHNMVGSVEASGTVAIAGYPVNFRGAETFSRGEVSWVNEDTGETEVRTIKLCEDIGSGLRLHIDYPPEITVLYDISMGCTHVEEACADWHNNINNFGGQPWIPLSAPHNKFTEFY